MPTQQAHTLEPRRAHYDRAFEEAVRQGYLTVQEAVERGHRGAYASSLERRFGLPPEIALKVTDNRVPLRKALQELEEKLTATQNKRQRRFNWRLMAVILTLILVAGFMSAFEWSREQEVGRQLTQASLLAPARVPAPDVESEPEPGVEHALPPSARVERDEGGWITHITASHPNDALDAFCKAATYTGGCLSTQVHASVPDFPGHRFGLFTLNDEANSAWLLHIRRDGRSGRWAVGTGLRPIVPFAPPRRAGAKAPEWPYSPLPDELAVAPRKPGSPDKS